jgi:hypothetical protein
MGAFKRIKDLSKYVTNSGSLCLKLGNGFIAPCALLDGAIPIVRNHQAQTLPGGLSNKLRGLALCRLRIDRKRPSNTP